MSHTQRPFLLPRPFPSGGTIGLVSPAGPSPASDIERAVEVLSARGCHVVVGDHAADNAELSGYPYLAGIDEHRADDLNRFLVDPAIDLILCVRGGYGCARILDRLAPAQEIRRDPKPIVGYSDITALSLFLAAHAGIVSFSGIMATAGDGFAEGTLDPFSEASFWQAVGADGFGSVYLPPEGNASWAVHRPPMDDGDTVTGPLFPACLSLLTSLAGTPYLPDMNGAVLVIEDVHEELYAVDRMLVQLRHAGVLENLAAVLIGSFNGTTADEEARLAVGVPRLVLENTPPSVAVASGVAYGHIARRLTLPVGAVGTADLRDGTFSFDIRP
ncbi:MAG: LD-carboxypeptidase [Akkermansiaceae bacterium]|nr:LD-carboxypeptidase [Armatimonadota bacterium]